MPTKTIELTGCFLAKPEKIREVSDKPVKIGSSGKGLILMFPLRKGPAKFSCNTPSLAAAQEPACTQGATLLLPLDNEHCHLGS